MSSRNLPLEKQMEIMNRQVSAQIRSLLRIELDKYSSLRRMVLYAVKYAYPSEYPFIALNAFKLSKRFNSRALNLACGVHLLQASTFVLDDVFDESDMRNNRPTVVREWGVKNAIIVAEVMQSIARRVISGTIRGLPNRILHRAEEVLSDLVKDVYTGQWLDLRNSGNRIASKKEYLSMIALTTGRFVSRVSSLGALASGASPALVDGLSRYGFHYGMALQLADDLIDVCETSDQTLKSFACDLKCRRSRLPLITALQLSPPDKVRTLKRYISSRRELSDREAKTIAKLICLSGALGIVLKMTEDHARAAIKSLEQFIDYSPARLLCELVEDIPSGIKDYK